MFRYTRLDGIGKRRGVVMILSFADRGTSDLFNRIDSKSARRTCPPDVWPVAQRKLDQINAAVSLASLAFPPGNRLEALRRDRAGAPTTADA